MFQTFLNILGVIGIVIVAAFVIVFLSDLFISIVDGTNGIFFKRNKRKNDDDEEVEVIKRPVLLNKPKDYDSKAQKVEQEERIFQKQIDERLFAAEANTEANEIDLEQAKQEEELARQTAQRQNVVEQRSKMQTQKPAVIPTPVAALPPETSPLKPEEEIKEIFEPEVEAESTDIEEDIDKVISEISKQTLKEVETQSEKDSEKHEEVLKRQRELEKEIEKLRLQIEGDKSTIHRLEEKIKNISNDSKTKVPTSTKEDLEERLEILKQRLKENEKELSSNRKEYVPLRRVSTTLESDKKKLRRKEAIVAKQKVVLYGVNNYVDIDEEKAKKLSEELDLLEGLRLSVQHCEEVMQKNKDRYPILERTNKILVKSNGHLKEDIARIEQQLKEIETSKE